MAAVVDSHEINGVCAIETDNNTLEKLLKYKEYFQVHPDKKIKWLGSFEELKCLIFDLFGVDGKWSSPRGTAKTFRNDKITITWYANKKSLLFQGQEGNRLKAVILNQSRKSSDLLSDSIVNHEVVSGVLNDDNLMLYANQTVAKAANISLSENIRSKSEVAESTPGCSSLGELQDFIDSSYQNILPQISNVNLSSTRVFDSSTPSRSCVGGNSAAIVDLFGPFKGMIEAKLEALKFELSEQKELIARSKQDICKLTSENLNLKSRVAELEENVFLKNKSIEVTKNGKTDNVISGATSGKNQSNEKHACLDKTTTITDPTINVESHSKTREDLINQSTKHNTPCPFLLRRGWCLKGRNCDFLHPKSAINVEPHFKTRDHHTNQPIKNTIPCPFLLRRGWCIKGQNCDFFHPSPTTNVENHSKARENHVNQPKKNTIPCPFLSRRGWCLKGENCDFYHPKLERNQRNFLFPPRPNACQPIRHPKYPPYPRPLMEIPLHLPQLPPMWH